MRPYLPPTTGTGAVIGRERSTHAGLDLLIEAPACDTRPKCEPVEESCPVVGLPSLKRSAVKPSNPDSSPTHCECQVFGRSSKRLARTVYPVNIAGFYDPSADVDAEMLVNATLGEVIEYHPDGLVRG